LPAVQKHQSFLLYNSFKKTSALRASFLPALISFISFTASFTSNNSCAFAAVNCLVFTNEMLCNTYNKEGALLSGTSINIFI